MIAAPANAAWIELASVGPVPRRAETFDVMIRPESGGLYVRPLRTAPFAPLDGLLFLAVGFVGDGGPEDYGQVWELGSCDLDGIALPGFDLHVTRLAVRWPDAPLRAERLWYPGARVADTIEQLGPATPEDQQKAATAQKALVRFSERIPQRGKHKGDGRIWSGGVPDFLDALWTRLEELTQLTRTPYGHDPTSRVFLSRMRGNPSARTMRTWLGHAELRVDHIKSGCVTRANYRQFIAG